MLDDLQRSLDNVLGSVTASSLTPVVERLIAQYRSGPVGSQPILRSAIDAAAYAVYRMPATYAAVHSGLSRLAARIPHFQPHTHLDVGGGTGAAVWAAAGLWPSLESSVALEQSEQVIALGRRLAAVAHAPVVRAARWERFTIGTSPALPAADLVTMSYVLGELPEALRTAVVPTMARKASAVALFEPGTPAGYDRIIAARRQLLGLGMTIVVPCPHDLACPIAPGEDWCHFTARVNRTSLHRQVKAGTLGHEDEKFSYVAAVWGDPAHAEHRIVRHPVRRKGLVVLPLCTGDGKLADRIVSRRHGDVYRDARDAEWGDAWPPSGQDGVG